MAEGKKKKEQTGKQVAWHHLKIEEALENLEVDKNGLSKEEIEERREEYGPNELPKQKGRAWYRILFSQFANPLMIILILATGTSLVFQEWLDVFVIWAAISINVILGFVEEYKADKSLEELKKYLPEEVRVRRDGEIREIKSTEIVPGDILIISTGDKMTADARIIKSESFEANEAALTGESAPVKKSAKPVDVGVSTPDQTSMVFAGTTAVAGHAEAVVIGTALNTEIGRITGLVSEVKDEKTPLQQQLDKFAKIIALAFGALAIMVFVLGVARGQDAVEMLKISIALAVAAVPEGLVVAVTVILAIGMQRILKRDALVRRLVASETLGSVSVICVDKTGTITTGEMAVDEVRLEDEKLLKLALHHNSSVETTVNTEGEEELTGSSTEIALWRYVEEEAKELEKKGCEKQSEIPFDSSRKYSAVLIECEGEQMLFAVGAPDVLLDLSDLSDEERKKTRETFEDMTARGLRVLMAAKKESPGIEGNLDEDDVVDLKPIGILGLRDPLREEVIKAIKGARSAGLRPIMITGDHPKTAMSIAQESGLIREKGEMITGAELNEMSEAEFEQRVEKIDVYARVMPSHKVRIVKAWQNKGQSVAMTGDGVNDAPAIKAADIGIAVGSGTQVSKETADMVLLKNSFSTIVAAIREGRIIFDNVRKVTVYLLADSFSEVIIVVGALIFGLPLPLLPAQILWINLITDGFPAAALTFEPGEKGIMHEPPRKKKEPILNAEMRVLTFIIGIFTASLLFSVFFFLYKKGLPIEEVRTFVFVKLGLDSLIYVFAVRKFRSSAFTTNPFENKWLVLGVMAGLVLQLLPLLIVPLRELFGFHMLTPIEWIAVIALASLNFVLIEIVKALYNRSRRKKST